MKRKSKHRIVALSLCTAMIMITGSMQVAAADLFFDGTEEIAETEIEEIIEAEVEEFSQEEGLSVGAEDVFSSGEEVFTAPEETAQLEEEEVFASEAATSGTVKGTKVKWKFDKGVLTLSGDGAVPNYIVINNIETGKIEEENRPPWRHLIEDVKEIKVLNGVDELGTEIFSDCVSLEKVTIAGSVKRIGRGCFHLCKNLKEINLTDGLEVIEQAAFNHCKMKTLTIPSTVRDSKDMHHIGLNGMVNLEHVYVKGKSNSCKSIDGVLFFNNGTELVYYPAARHGSYVIPNGTKVIFENAFAGIDITDIHIPNTVKKIGEYAFYYCYNLKEIVFPKSVKIIPNNACYGCEKLEKVTLENGVREIQKEAFSGCSVLSQVKLSNTLKVIEKEAFSDCKALESIKLPASLTKVSRYAFDPHTKLIIDEAIPNYHEIENGEKVFAVPVTVNGTRDYKRAFKLLGLINKERREAGSPPLAMDKELLECGMKRAGEVALSTTNERPIDRPYYTMNPEMDGELVDVVLSDEPERLMKEFKYFYGKRLTLLNSSYLSAGVGCVEVGGVRYWEVCFSESPKKNVRASSYSNKAFSQKVLVSPESVGYAPEFFLTKTSLKRGEMAKVSVFWNSKFLTDSGVRLYSSNSKVCKIEKGGIRAVAPGSATIYLYYGENREYATKIKVNVRR